ncbi:CDP-glycerol glycerophosphotransferase family protein [Heyndrickxia camelliae]|uniref:CDP-glycerol glycerophosphotransferase family protein n=1 Tax=Heyndrickxia camelliae TaxID=1707093 RepID=A0A2N3LDP0_9BACI|nr:CDP-glycerol glycerophosphotransferase family protein [Heyndrickxia camelliae]PKR82657.1 CDP-glycerol glycerophosphotransferase family protein [Heyndrickxia camelliae]
MKTFIKKIIKKYIFNHRLETIKVENNTTFYMRFNKLYPLVKRKLVFKNRETGRKLQKEIKGKTCFFPFEELVEVNPNGKFDVYIKFSFFKYTLLKRVDSNKNVNLTEYNDRKNNIISLFKNKNNHISFQIKKSLFKNSIVELKNVGTNFYLTGKIVALDTVVPAIAEIVLVRRDTNKGIGYKCQLDSNLDSDTFTYSSVIVLEKMKNDLIINSRWDVFLQLRDTNKNILYRELITFSDNTRFEKEEERYIVNVSDNNNVASLYVTMGKFSLALWYTDKDQFQKTYNIAKGKSKFNETCETHKLNEKMVFFESFLGKNYSGNPKYIYEEMLRNDKYKNYTFVWSYSGENPEEIPGNPIIVNREEVEYYEYLAKSKYWVNNILFPVHRKREGNKYLQTWHGTPLKRLGYDIEIDGPEVLARENFYIESRNWDYLVSANNYSTEIFKRAFKFNKHVLEYGYPANDIFYNEEMREKVNKIRIELGIPQDKKVILYAPTWRDNESVNSWKHSFSLKFDLEEFYKNLKDEYILILRMHHLIADSLVIDEKYKEFVYDLSKYDDIQELYVMSDILITDYSSVFFDYANSKKPILFFAYDFDNYKENVRGFYLDMFKDLPGPIINNSGDLLNAIQNINSIYKNYELKYDEFYNRFCKLENGKAAQSIIEKVFE